MTVEKIAKLILILGLCFVIALVAIIITIRLAQDAVRSICRKLGLLHPAQEPKPLIEVFPTGDIPQPETSNMGSRLSVHR